MKEFVHLNLHSEFSIKDGIANIKTIIDKAIYEKNTALALTDINNIFGLVKFYDALYVNFKKDDTNFVIYGLAGIKDYEKISIKKCLDKKTHKNHQIIFSRVLECGINFVRASIEHQSFRLYVFCNKIRIS